jgi:hypothetical protein
VVNITDDGKGVKKIDSAVDLICTVTCWEVERRVVLLTVSQTEAVHISHRSPVYPIRHLQNGTFGDSKYFRSQRPFAPQSLFSFLHSSVSQVSPEKNSHNHFC